MVSVELDDPFRNHHCFIIMYCFVFYCWENLKKLCCLYVLSMLEAVIHQGPYILYSTLESALVYITGEINE